MGGPSLIVYSMPPISLDSFIYSTLKFRSRELGSFAMIHTSILEEVLPFTEKREAQCLEKKRRESVDFGWCGETHER